MATMLKVSPGSRGLLSPLLPLLEGEGVTELLINKPGEVWVEEKNKMTRHEMPSLNPTYLKRLFTFIANENEQVLNEEKPFLSGSIFDGSRVQLVIPPVSTTYILSIRKKNIQRLAFEDYEEQGFFEHTQWFSLEGENNNKCDDMDSELISLMSANSPMAFIKKAINQHKTIIVSGGTSSGKTTFLNTCTSFIHPAERIISLEDTLEIEIPHLNQVNLKALKNGSVTMRDLVQATLRLRPDRIIMGEIRGPEILDFISACSTGHDGSIATLHANNPRMAISRMISLYKQNNVPAMRDDEIRDEILSVVDVIIQLTKHPEHGRIAKQIWYKGGSDA